MVRKTSLLLFLWVACLLLNPSPVFAQQTGQLRTVTRVIDGDTIVLENGETIRLIGVDTPETHHPRKPVEAFGEEATAFTRHLVDGQQVLVDTDPANTHLGHKDKYGRTLAYVWNKRGKFVNAEIIEQGYGHALTQYPFRYINTFRALEERARQQENGLWMSSEREFRGTDPQSKTPTDRNVHDPHTRQSQSIPLANSGNETIRAENSGYGSESASSYLNDPVVGHTATGIPIHQGPRRGQYHITSGGHKSYHSSSSSRSSRGGRSR